VCRGAARKIVAGVDLSAELLRVMGRANHADSRQDELEKTRNTGHMNQALDSFTLPICLTRPRRLSGISAWIEHIPFGMNLVAALRPGILVELGTHGGDSYCAFCQAVAENNLATRCFAIDTWVGDSQAGFYGPEVLADLRTHHDPLYGGFSVLIQSTFDEAANHFEDGTIDFLHVDGLHTREAVQHDLDTWLPKMSPSGVLLVHDINVRERDFGVAAVWAALKARYPSFEFPHGHGLGVVAVGAHPPDALAPLLSAGEHDTAFIRAFFFALGQRFSLEEGAKVGATSAQRALAAAATQAQSAVARAEAAEREVVRQAEANAQLSKKSDDTAQLLFAKASSLEQSLAALRKENETLEGANKLLRNTLEERSATLQTIYGTAAWRTVTRYWQTRDRILAAGTAPRRVFDRVVDLVKQHPTTTLANAKADPEETTRDRQYGLWLERNRMTPSRLTALAKVASAFAYKPLVSVLTPVYDIDEQWLRRCIESVRQQVYDQWELVLVDDGSKKRHVPKVLAEYSRADPRIRTLRLERNSGIVRASSAALGAARGEFVALLDHDDELSLDALFEVVNRLQGAPTLDLIYSDEDKLDDRGERVEPFFKPDWSPDLLLSMNYIGHLAVMRRSVLEEAGGFRAGFEGSQDYDLYLRVTERSSNIAHVPKVLYHWRKVPHSAAAQRTAKPYALESGQRAIEEALQRRSTQGKVSMPLPGVYRVRYDLPASRPSVSIVILTRDHADMLRTCIESIENRTDYREYEISVVDNGSSELDAVAYLEQVAKRHRVVRRDVPFNWSTLNNLAVPETTGDLLLFMNNDMEVLNSDWLDAMVEHAVRPGVGAVGAKLLYPTRTLQHAGVVLGLGGVAGHAFKHLPDADPGYFYLPHVIRDASAVTGACMMVPRPVFKQFGGFDESLRVAFNDIDFCLRLRSKGYLVIYTPFARVLHYESATRKALHPVEDELLMRTRWATVLPADPYYNPNLTTASEDYLLQV